ncbi:barstar family protein [Nocardioides limicola]|uniref:barstar family protein n=1 Tax=Nocardioides limicola TaxID=2803368 RepID=UPI00193C3BBC|nr:barstar family protein [Nocardioides sp. DJM-14]
MTHDLPASAAVDALLAAGWRVATADTAGVEDRREVLGRIGEALGFPETFGRNLDALNDSLDDVTGPAALHWTGWAALAYDDPQQFAMICSIMGDRVLLLLG